MKSIAGIALSVSLLVASSALAAGGDWKAVADESRVAFGSVKKEFIGEVHHFNAVTGSVKEDGSMTISIDLSSVETNIDIRNERMVEHVFQAGKATAVLSGQIDMEEVTSLKPGETALVDLEAKLTFAGTENNIDAELIVIRLSEDRVMVSTADFIMLSTKDLGIDAGIDTLMKLAKLPGITRTTPVSARVVFEK